MPPLLGFTASGVTAGSWAAAMQSAMHGAVPAGSLFAIMQSVGATATIVPALIAGASAAGIAGAIEAGQAQRPGENQEEESDAGIERTNGQHRSEVQEGRDEGKEHEFTEGKNGIFSDKSSENQTDSSSSLHEGASIQVAKSTEDGLMGWLPNVGQGGKLFRAKL